MKLGITHNMFQFERGIDRTHEPLRECEDIGLWKRKEKCNKQNEGIQIDIW